MKRKERIGFDWDGTLTKWPPIIAFLVSVFNSTQTPKFLYKPFWKFLIYLPIFPNVKRLEIIKKLRNDYYFIIISGRREGEKIIEEILLGYGLFYVFDDVITPRKTTRLTTQQFKEKVCKATEVDWYFDDNRYTIYYLREKGIKAIRV